MARMAKQLTVNVAICTDETDELVQKTTKIAVDDDIKMENRTIRFLGNGVVESSVVVHLKNKQTITEGSLINEVLQCRVSSNTKSLALK